MKVRLTMGKDKEGKFHPRKGKSSGSIMQGAGLQSNSAKAIDHQMQLQINTRKGRSSRHRMVI